LADTKSRRVGTTTGTEDGAVIENASGVTAVTFRSSGVNGKRSHSRQATPFPACNWGSRRENAREIPLNPRVDVFWRAFCQPRHHRDNRVERFLPGKQIFDVTLQPSLACILQLEAGIAQGQAVGVQGAGRQGVSTGLLLSPQLCSMTLLRTRNVGASARESANEERPSAASSKE
jgi:hypothetical protein